MGKEEERFFPVRNPHLSTKICTFCPYPYSHSFSIANKYLGWIITDIDLPITTTTKIFLLSKKNSPFDFGEEEMSANSL